jgi:acetoacetyl-CoA reductase/3-oxoacyl-[acyl-carrier protein] reductase
MKKKTIVITGGTRGIGRALVMFFARNHHVAACYSSDDESALETKEMLRSTNCDAMISKVDVSGSENVNVWIADIIRIYGRVDVVINNAGLNIDKPFLEMSEEDFTRVVDVNLKGSFLVAQAAAKHMMTSGGGSLIFFGSTTAIRGRRNGSNYCPSKAGLLTLTKCLAAELGPHIRVNCVIPGFTRTPETKARFNLDLDEKKEIERRAIPLQRMGETEDIVNTVDFLVSENASYINGQKIIVDGGEYMY